MKVFVHVPASGESELIAELLRAQDYEPVVVETFDDPISQIVSASPNLIISDYEAEGGGADFINYLLASDLSEYPYIIFLTDKDDGRAVIDSLGPIPGDFLSKPINDIELKARLTIAERTLALQTRLQTVGAGHSESLAMYDHLTSVLNRQAVYERALAELNRAQRSSLQVCLAMLEVINLDQIRDEHGPEVRDQAVRFVARATRANVRIYDLVGRWIGAKFLILLPGITEEHTQSVMERIHSSITSIRVTVPDGERVQLDVRVGFARTEKDKPEQLYSLIERANEALGSASNARPVVVYQPSEA